jgi:hypothetical protein
MRNKQSVTLYNVLFPVWLLVWIPSFLWILLIPLNFAIDYLVLYKSLPASTERKAFCCNLRTPSDGFAEQNGRDAERAD